MGTTTYRNSKNERHIGIDVGKSTLDVHLYELGRSWQVENTPAGIKTLLGILGFYHLTRVVVEATGGYERALVEACAAKGLPVVVVQPIQVRQFAKAQGILAKTDRIHARVIAAFGALLQPEIREIQSEKVRRVRDLLTRKRQLMEARTQELNRQHKAPRLLAATHGW